MPTRDPQTGKFVSGKKAGRERSITATYGTTIPAADLSGGTSIARVSGEAAVFVDFSDKLHNDEVFHLDRIQGRLSVAMPTTATAEGYAMLEYVLSQDGNDSSWSTSNAFWSGSPHTEDGIVDITQVDTDDESTLYAGVSTVAPSVADTANNMTAGAENDHDDILRVWPEDETPVFDENDELAFPHQWHVDNVSDHAVYGEVVALLEGRVLEVENC